MLDDMIGLDNSVCFCLRGHALIGTDYVFYSVVLAGCAVLYILDDTMLAQ